MSGKRGWYDTDAVVNETVRPGRAGRPAEPAPSGSDPARGFSAAFLDRFELAGLLGEGGMGAVYRARHRALGRDVAIKFMRSVDAETRARFGREGRVLAKLGHPNLMQVFEAGEEAGDPYLVFEIVEGQSLAARLEERGPLEIGDALEIARQAAAGLAHAHAEGVVHRDVKSANILIASDGSVKVCDFGLAREAAGELLTAAGVLMGTPEYLAPELVEGQDASAASDIYSLGCVLMELLTGRVPFPSSTPAGDPVALADVIAGHLRIAPPIPSERRPEIARDVDRLVLSCLAKAPAARPAGAEALGRALERLLEKHDVRRHLREAASGSARPAGKVEHSGTRMLRRPSGAQAVPGAAPGVGNSGTRVVAARKVESGPAPDGRDTPRGRGRGVWWAGAALTIALGLAAVARDWSAPPRREASPTVTAPRGLATGDLPTALPALSLTAGSDRIAVRWTPPWPRGVRLRYGEAGRVDYLVDVPAGRTSAEIPNLKPGRTYAVRPDWAGLGVGPEHVLATLEGGGGIVRFAARPFNSHLATGRLAASGQNVCIAYRTRSSDLVSRQSHDSGRTWTEERVVEASAADARALPSLESILTAAESDDAWVAVTERRGAQPARSRLFHGNFSSGRWDRVQEIASPLSAGMGLLTRPGALHMLSQTITPGAAVQIRMRHTLVRPGHSDVRTGAPVSGFPESLGFHGGAIASDGSLHFVGCGLGPLDRPVYGRSDASGARWEAAVPLAGGGEAMRDLRIAAADRTVVVVWERPRSERAPGALRVARGTGSGSRWTEPRSLHEAAPSWTSEIAGTSLALAASGDVAAVVWCEELEPGKRVLQFRVSRDGGATFEGRATVPLAEVMKVASVQLAIARDAILCGFHQREIGTYQLRDAGYYCVVRLPGLLPAGFTASSGGSSTPFW